MPYYGRYITSGDTDLGEIGASVQRACVFDPMPEHGWGHTFKWYGGKPLGQGGNPTIKLAIWETDASKNPTTRLAYHAGFTATNQMSYGGDGQAYSAAVQNVNASKSPGTNAVALWAGKRYSLGFVAAAYAARHGMTAAANIAGDNEQFYDRFGVSTPTDPNGYTSAHTEGWLSMAIQYVANRAPTAATTSPSGTITTTTPTFTGTFSDPDSTYGDKLTKYQIQVYRVSDGALMWDSGQVSASSSEQSAGAFTRAYAGTALSQGVTYQWRCRVADWFGTWSPWTGYTQFTVNIGGTVGPTSPQGKQETRQPSPFTASWSHPSGQSTNAVEVRVRDVTGAVLFASATLTKSVAAGGTITVTWTEAFGSSQLSWGAAYTWEMRARDTSGVWSNWASAAITTNAAPSIPSNLSPANSMVSNSRPRLVCTCSDIDDTVATGFIVKCRIKDGNGNILQTRSMSLKSGTSDTWEYQTTSADLASYGTYRWDAYAGDGTLWSGEQTSEANAVKSAEAIFVYSAGPQITITSPTNGGTVTTHTPTYQWSVAFSGGATQVSYRVRVYRSSDNQLVYDSGVVYNTTATSHAQPSGYLRNGETYRLTVSVTDSNNLTGQSTVTFTVSYTPPAAVTGFTASPHYGRFDAVPSAVRLVWDASELAGFDSYVIGRREAGADPDTELILARITSQAQTTVIDWLPASGTEYVYSIRQIQNVGLDQVASARQEQQVQIDLDGVVLCLAANGDERVTLRLIDDRGREQTSDLAILPVWGEAAPLAVFGSLDYATISGTFQLAAGTGVVPAELLSALHDLRAARAPLCYRDERGRKLFCVITRIRVTDTRIASYAVELELTEIAYQEGVA